MSFQSHQSGPVPHSARNGSKLILCVDDESVILCTLEKILRANGYDVLSASNGEKALEVFEAYLVDLVLLDYIMPGMDGRLVAQKMKAGKPLVPIIMVSGNFVPEEAITCVDRFIIKGDGPAVLLAEIAQILGPISHLRSA